MQDIVSNFHILQFQWDFVCDLLLMNDIFEPVARVMENLKGISVPLLKAYCWVQQLISWLEEAAKECNEGGNMDFFPRMKANATVYNSHFVLS